MNYPKTYVQVNVPEKLGAQHAIRLFSNRIHWRADGRDSVFDAGCGPGDLTVGLLMPILPKNFRRLVGGDISDKMIDYARKTYVHPKLSFEKYDLTTALEKQSFNYTEPFDHIFSFYALMFCSKVLGNCIGNFHKLLVPGGDMVLAFPAKHSLLDIWIGLSLLPRWAKYMPDVDKFYHPYRNSENPAKELRDLLTKTGFTDIDVRVIQEHSQFESLEQLRGFLFAVNPFIHRVPDGEKARYMEDYMRIAMKKVHILDGNNDDKGNRTFYLPAHDFLAFARKKF